MIPVMLLSSNGGGKTDGIDTGAPVKGAAALSIDNGTSKETDAPQSLPTRPSPATTAPVVEPPNESSENASAEDEPTETQSVPMLLTYQPKPSLKSQSAAGATDRSLPLKCCIPGGCKLDKGPCRKYNQRGCTSHTAAKISLRTRERRRPKKLFPCGFVFTLTP